MSQRRLTKVKYDGKRVLIRYEIDRGDDADELEICCTQAPAPALVEALRGLRPVVGRICEFPAAYVEQLEIRGVSFSWGGEERVMGAVITALKHLAHASAPLCLNTPHLPSEAYGKNAEQHTLPTNAVERLQTLILAGFAYVDGVRAQTDLFAVPAASPEPSRAALEAVAALAPAPGSGIDAVTISAGGKEVTLTPADGERMKERLRKSRRHGGGRKGPKDG